MLCMVLVCQLHRVVLYYSYSFILLLLFDNYLSFVRLLFSFDSFALFIVHCSLFMRKIFISDPGLYYRYFDPFVLEVPVTITIYASQ
jgi:hypothetical protein